MIAPLCIALGYLLAALLARRFTGQTARQITLETLALLAGMLAAWAALDVMK